MALFTNRRAQGRPVHPDVLTPAEWRVLEHVRGGRTNQEIAVALGLSLNTVKTHISSMLGKLDMHHRYELAAWPGAPAEASRAVLHRARFAGGFAGLFRFAGAWGGRILVGGAVVGAAAVFLVAMQAMNDSGAPSGAVGATETPSATPTETAVVEETVRLGTPVDFPYVLNEPVGATKESETGEREDIPYSFAWLDVHEAPIVAETVRAEMETILDDFVARFADAPPDSPIRQEITISTDLIARSSDVIGVRLDVFRFFGANGAGSATTLWFDLREGTALPATALLDGASALDRTSDLTRDAFWLARNRTELGLPLGLADADRATADSLLAEGTQSTPEHFDALGFTVDGDLLVELDEGQVAASAAGILRVLIPAPDALRLLSDFGLRAQAAARR